MSQLQARVNQSPRAFHVEGYEKIEYDLVYVDGVFALDNDELAESYRPYGRALMVIDETVYALYGDEIRSYFDHHDIALTAMPVQIRETAKSLADFRANHQRVQRFRTGTHRAGARRRRRIDD